MASFFASLRPSTRYLASMAAPVIVTGASSVQGAVSGEATAQGAGTGDKAHHKKGGGFVNPWESFKVRAGPPPLSSSSPTLAEPPPRHPRTPLCARSCSRPLAGPRPRSHDALERLQVVGVAPRPVPRPPPAAARARLCPARGALVRCRAQRVVRRLEGDVARACVLPRRVPCPGGGRSARGGGRRQGGGASSRVQGPVRPGVEPQVLPSVVRGSTEGHQAADRARRAPTRRRRRHLAQPLCAASPPSPFPRRVSLTLAYVVNDPHAPQTTTSTSRRSSTSTRRSPPGRCTSLPRSATRSGSRPTLASRRTR